MRTNWMLLLAGLGLLPVLEVQAQEAAPPPPWESDEDDGAPAGAWQSYAPPIDQGQDEAGPPLDEQTYRQVLDPHGRWVHRPPYGWVWMPHPAAVGPDWRPYTRGHWVYTNYGWTWESDFDWGWVPFHYGRWHVIDGRWAWIPGREWAPAWVAWRHDDEVVGWAPLPWGVSVGATVEVGPTWWSFVPVVHFGAPVLRTYYVPGHRVHYYYGRTRPVVHVRHYRKGAWGWYGGPRRTWVETRWGRPVHRATYVPAHRRQQQHRPAAYVPARGHGSDRPAYRPAPKRRPAPAAKPARGKARGNRRR